jgi:hypothetical protein
MWFFLLEACFTMMNNMLLPCWQNLAAVLKFLEKLS